MRDIQKKKKRIKKTLMSEAMHTKISNIFDTVVVDDVMMILTMTTSSVVIAMTY